VPHESSKRQMSPNIFEWLIKSPLWPSLFSLDSSRWYLSNDANNIVIRVLVSLGPSPPLSFLVFLPLISPLIIVNCMALFLTLERLTSCGYHLWLSKLYYFSKYFMDYVIFLSAKNQKKILKIHASKKFKFTHCVEWITYLVGYNGSVWECDWNRISQKF